MKTKRSRTPHPARPRPAKLAGPVISEPGPQHPAPQNAPLNREAGLAQPLKTSLAKPGAKARILVVDDHPIVREGLVGLLNRQPDMLCCADVGTPAAAQDAVARQTPDLAIIDLRLGSADGLELIKTLGARLPGLRMLVLSQLDQVTFAERVLRAGAHGYVMKEQAADELLEAIRTVLAGEVYVSRGLALRLLRSLSGAQAKSLRGGVERLTDRELHVLHLLGAAMTTRKIAAALHLSLKTVETHRENIKKKLNLTNAAELLRFAVNWYGQQVSLRPLPPVSDAETSPGTEGF